MRRGTHARPKLQPEARAADRPQEGPHLTLPYLFFPSLFFPSLPLPPLASPYRTIPHRTALQARAAHRAQEGPGWPQVLKEGVGLLEGDGK